MFDWLNGDAAQPHNKRINVYSALFRLAECATECYAVHFEHSFQTGLVLNLVLKSYILNAVKNERIYTVKVQAPPLRHIEEKCLG